MQDFRLKTVIPRYKKALTHNVKDISTFLNTQITEYEKKIDTLRSLIEVDCDFQPKDLKKVNESLSSHLYIVKEKIREKFSNNSVLNMRTLSENELETYVDTMNEYVCSIPTETLTEEIFQDIFSKSTEELLKLFLGTESDRNGLIYFNYHRNSKNTIYSIDSINLEKLTLDYLENYVKSICLDRLAWNNENLEDYIKCLENQIFTFSEEFEESVRIIIKNILAFPLLSISRIKSFEDFKTRFKNNIYSSVVVFKSGLDKDLENTVSVQREKIFKNLFELTEKLNLSNLSEGIKSIISNIKKQERETLNLVSDKIKDLESQRKFIEQNLKFKKLKNFSEFPETVNMIDSSVCLKELEASELFCKIVIEPNSPLNDFLNQRNEYGKILNYQLDPARGDYAELIFKIRDFSKKIQSQNKNKIVTLILHSLEQMTIDLKKHYLASLELDFEKFTGIFINNNLLTKYSQVLEKVEMDVRVILIEIASKDNKELIKILVDNSFNNFQHMSDSSLKAQIKEFLIENKDNFKKGLYWDTNSEKFHKFCEALILKQEKEFLTKLENSFSENISIEDVGFDRLDILTKALKSVNIVTQILSADFSKITKLFESKESEVKMCQDTIKYALTEFKEELQLKENDAFKKQLEKSTFSSVQNMLDFFKENNSSLFQKVAENFNNNYNVLSNEKETEDKLFKVLVKLRESLSKEFTAVLKDKALNELNNQQNTLKLSEDYLKY